MFRSLWNGLVVGWYMGLLVGSLDLVARLLHGTYEWYELYLALLLPAICLAGITAVVQLALSLLARVFQIGTSLEGRVDSFRVVLMLVVVSMGGIRMNHFLAPFGDTTQNGMELATDIVVVGCVIYFIYLIGQTHIKLALETELEKNVIVRTGHILFQFFTFVVIACAATDLYLMHSSSTGKSLGSKPLNKPNVIVITLDTLRARNLSFLGYEKLTTPHLEEFSRESILYSSAYAPTSWTLPSHASLFTGKWIHQHGADTQHQQLDGTQLTLAEILKGEGYQTAGFVAGPYVKARYGLSQGFDLYKDRLDFFEYHTLYERFSIRRLFEEVCPKLFRFVFQTDGEKSAEELNEEVFEWLKNRRSGSFFLFLNYFDAHDPYTRGAELREFPTENAGLTADYANSLIQKLYYDPKARVNNYRWNKELRDFMLSLYDAEIKYLDVHLGRLFERLKKLSLWENSLIVITSDHGEEFFEHGGLQHRQTLYSEVLHVPLLIKLPRASRAQRVDDPVSLVQVFPAVLNLLGFRNRVPTNLPKVPYLFGDFQEDSFVFLSRLLGIPRYGGTDMNGILRNNRMLIQVDTPGPRIPNALFDLHVDPLEQNNLMNAELEMKLKLAERLEKELGNGGS